MLPSLLFDQLVEKLCRQRMTWSVRLFSDYVRRSLCFVYSFVTSTEDNNAI
jgi:hypothetical protein